MEKSCCHSKTVCTGTWVPTCIRVQVILCIQKEDYRWSVGVDRIHMYNIYVKVKESTNFIIVVDTSKSRTEVPVCGTVHDTCSHIYIHTYIIHVIKLSLGTLV